jgi:dihydrofolate reductase
VFGRRLFFVARVPAPRMTKLTYSASISLDGFTAGPNQGPKQPLGVRGELLHEWMRKLAVWRKAAGLKGGITNANTKIVEGDGQNVGALIMGRNMFGGGPGPWPTPAWDGWWGDDPPFHLPVFVLTHYKRKPLICQGGTTFYFVTKGPATARKLAIGAAVGKDVAICGGSGVAKQFLAAGLIDEFTLHLVPVFLGGGVRLFDNELLSQVRLKQVKVVEAPGVAHLTYRAEHRSRSQHRK